MSEISEDDLRNSAKDLANSVSTQANYVIKIWLVLIAATAALTFPTTGKDGMVTFPFAFGKADKATYDLVMFFILSALIVAYCQGYAKAYQAVSFVHDLKPNANMKRFFDFYRMDSVARPWPLVDVLKEFFSVPRWLRNVFYVCLRIFTLAILLGLPGFALGMAACRVIVGMSNFWISVAGVLALFFVTIAIIAVLVAEFRFTKQVLCEN